MLLITDLPRIMRKQGWPIAARCMERWFSLGPRALTSAEKDGRVALASLDAQTLATDILTMDWALGFDRVRDAVDDLVAGTWNTPNGRAELLTRLRAAQLPHPASQKPEARWDFGDLTRPVATIDASFEVNYRPVGAMTDPLDDFYGAVGRATLKAAASGHVTNGTDGRPKSMAVTALGIYLRDSYDFVGDQFLGLWSELGVNRSRGDEFLAWKLPLFEPIAIDAEDYSKAVATDRAAFERPIVSPFGDVMVLPPRTEGQLAEFETHQWHSVSNADFRRYRARSMMGYDYINVSDVRVVRLPKPVIVTF